jgi:pilus assembly protein CpaF
MAQQELSVFHAAIQNFLAPVVQFLNDSTITEILINGPDQIFIERAGKLEKTNATFHSEDDLRAAVNSIAQSVGRRIDNDSPRLDARLPDGSRIAAVIPPCSRNGTTVSIRKFTQTEMTLKDYVKIGSLSSTAAQFLDVSMYLGKNILVSGGTGSGKTTLLSLLCGRIPKGQRLIVIEDSTELNIKYEHVVMFETRMADQSGKGEISMRDLLKSSLRLRPDRIVVGEVRSVEALELINAMNTGHKGCLGTVHANSAQDAIVRLESLAQGADARMSEKALRYQVSAAIDLIIQVSRFQDGSRRVAQIAEVRGLLPDGSYDVIPIFNMSRLVRTTEGKLQGELEPTGETPTFMQEILDNGLPFTPDKLTKRAS